MLFYLMAFVQLTEPVKNYSMLSQKSGNWKLFQEWKYKRNCAVKNLVLIFLSKLRQGFDGGFYSKKNLQERLNATKFAP